MIPAPFLFQPALHYFPMEITRRIFAFSLLIAPFIFSVAGGSADKPAANRKYLVFVGTYTTKTESKGIYAYEFDADTGRLTPKGLAAETPDPSWVAVHPGGKYLYAANEAGKASTVSAFAVDVKSGKLTLLNQMPSLGEDPCYLSFDKTGKYVLVANYSSGTIAVFPILAEGRLGEHTAMVKDAGATGPNKKHQEGPHAHWIETSPDNRFVLVADLGLDEVLVYKLDATSGTLTPNEPAFARLKAGSGPRHAVFYPNGKFVFAVSELSSTATSFAYDVKKGTLKETGTASTLPPGFSGRNDVAETAVHPNGKFLYVSNRGNDSIAILSIHPGNRTLAPAGGIPTGGKEPRHFAIDPSGKYLLAENQFSNNIVVFKIDPATGGLTPTGQVVEVPSPVDIAFLQEN
ncbi:MAG TPA: lactonase family protein [Candidatus Limnocylindria bacterium]|nr:lactonase family protein [Candidatus Limnocylindria bacterium]